MELFFYKQRHVDIFTLGQARKNKTPLVKISEQVNTDDVLLSLSEQIANWIYVLWRKTFLANIAGLLVHTTSN